MTIQLEQLAAQVGAALLEKKLILTTAESCTGGGLSYFITSTPGSSAWFEYGFVTYSDGAKKDLLKVDEQILQQFGAVSEQAAQAMVTGALAHSGASIAVAITGIAGPKGGSVEKPVGTVWFGWAKKSSAVITKAQHFAGNRSEIRLRSIEYALEGLLKLID